jgi:hypothetical protein
MSLIGRMDAQEKYGYWLETAQYDLDTADAMFISKQRRYSHGF